MMLNISTNLPQRRYAIDTTRDSTGHRPVKQFTRLHQPAPDGKKVVNLRDPSPFSAIPAPPMAIAEYVSLKGSSEQFTGYLDNLKKTMRSVSLEKYQHLRTPENFLGKGAFKICHDIGDGKVLVVGDSAQELAKLAMLERAGVPVAKVHEIGMVQKDGFPREAYVQQKLKNFYFFDQKHPDAMHSEFLDSPLLNEKTVSSLRAIRSFTQKFDMLDLQGGIAQDGVFRLTDILGVLEPEGESPPFIKEQSRKLDNLIRSAEIEVQSRQRGKLKKAA
ncbi:hypothetical protein ACSFA3_20210 [Variovorax sp. RHLX14]|uniref:hypothetical protein n=1 Tax=Variovorax sp. RHLX14 TaxID=1259731 RepID=UPI003F45A8FF